MATKLHGGPEGQLLRGIDGEVLAKPEWLEPARPLRVLLIQPPPTQSVRSLLPHIGEESDGIGFKPPLGILYVASVLADRSPHEVKVIDGIAQRLSYEDIRREAVAFQPDVVGISAWTDFWYPAYQTGQLIKDALPATHLTYGGPHVSIYPQETLDAPFVDSVIVGDGEVPFLYLCNMVANDALDNDLPGLHLAGQGVKPGDGTFFIQKDLDGLPIPDRELLPIGLYGSVLGKNATVTTMITSRGCPFKCTFCKLNFQKTLTRSAESVVEEFERIQALGIREVEVYDDTFTWSTKRLKAICHGLIDAGNTVEWAVRDRVSSARPELLHLMYRAGCRRIHYGIESGVDRVIERMRKHITTAQARDAVRWAREAGMTVLTYFMFGNLDETYEDMKQTIEFSLELDADFAEFSITMPYAGTEMYLEALRTGLIEDDYWRRYAVTPTPDFLPPKIIETHADLPTLIALRDEGVRRFYYRPRYIVRQMRQVRSPGEFARKARMGVRLLVSVLRSSVPDAGQQQASVYNY